MIVALGVVFLLTELTRRMIASPPRLSANAVLAHTLQLVIAGRLRLVEDLLHFQPAQT